MGKYNIVFKLSPIGWEFVVGSGKYAAAAMRNHQHVMATPQLNAVNDKYISMGRYSSNVPFSSRVHCSLLSVLCSHTQTSLL